MLSGLWIIFPAYMLSVFGSDLLEALDLIAVEPIPAISKKEE